MKMRQFLSVVLTFILLSLGLSSFASERTANPGVDPNEARRQAQYEAAVIATGAEGCPGCIARLKTKYRIKDDTTFRQNKDGKDGADQATKAGTK